MDKISPSLNWYFGLQRRPPFYGKLDKVKEPSHTLLFSESVCGSPSTTHIVVDPIIGGCPDPNHQYGGLYRRHEDISLIYVLFVDGSAKALTRAQFLSGENTLDLPIK